jgi:ribosomal protein L30
MLTWRDALQEPRVRVTQVRGTSGQKPKTNSTLRALGLRGVGSARYHRVDGTLVGMLRRVEHMVKIEPVLGEVKELSPSLSTAPTTYELPGKRQGEIRASPSGRRYRIEDRGDTVAVAWQPEAHLRRVFQRIHDIGESGSSFIVVKNGQITEQIPWRKALPLPILESPSKVELVRLDTETETITWERAESDDIVGEIQVLVGRSGWSGLSPLLTGTASRDVTGAVLQSVEDVTKK